MPLISITVPNNETSGLPLRGLAMILAAVAILLAGWGVYSATRDDPSEPEQTTDTPVAAVTSNTTQPSSTTASAAVFFTQGNAVEERAAQALAEQLGITAAPRPERLNSTPPGIILVITEDLK